MKKAEAREAQPLDVDREQSEDLITHINWALQEYGHEFLSEIFAYPGFTEASISVRPLTQFVPFAASLSMGDLADNDKRPAFRMGRIIEHGAKSSIIFRSPVGGQIGLRRIEDRLFSEIAFRAIFGRMHRRERSAIYIPAARTGLMLALRALIAQLFESDEVSTPMPKPLTDFLQRLSGGIGPLGSDRNEVVEWLQSEILHGAIQVSDDEVPSYAYLPENSAISLPLYASSSMVTELAPFLVLLQAYGNPGRIIFEEPEAHLHLSAQRAMARALAQLLSSGSKVMVTTHSDTFVQQINNLMSISRQPDREPIMKHLGYTVKDIINPAHATAYEFVYDGPYTTVRELPSESGGFIVPSLNETLVSLAKETLSLQEGE